MVIENRGILIARYSTVFFNRGVVISNRGGEYRGIQRFVKPR
ncbi:unnamed protein product, partial [Rotaria sp. Silwood2]